MRIATVVALSEPGSRKKANEDAVLRAPGIPLFAIADGTGGPEAAPIVLQLLRERGEVIREQAQRVASDASTASRLSLAAFFEHTFEWLGEQLREEAARRSKPGLAASLVAATVIDRFAYVAHVGDARAYLFRAGELRCLTNDHTVAMLQLQRKQIDFREYLTSPFRHTLSQALGATPQLDVEVSEVRVVSGDVLLLCSNGLTRVADEERIAGALADDDLDAAGHALMQWAYKAGAPDNVSLLMCRVVAEETSKPVGTAVVDAVRECPLFRELSDADWSTLAPYLDEVNATDGEILYRAGDPGDRVYIVGGGRFALRGKDGEEREAVAGEVFGELALAGSGPRLETAVAGPGVSHAFALSREGFERVLRLKPMVAAHVVQALLGALGERVREQSRRLEEVRRALTGR